MARQKKAPAARRQHGSIGMGRWCVQVRCRTTTGCHQLTDGVSSPADLPPKPTMTQGVEGRHRARESGGEGR
jgi:hypothetical protein